MNKLILSLLTLLFFTSCETLTGGFTALEEITLKDSKGKSVTVSQGVYLDSKIKLKSKRRLKLIVDDRTYEFKIPRGTKIPTTNGTIELTSSEVKQPYDVRGEISTTVEHGEVQRESESCEWQERYQVCERDSNGRRVCRTEYRTRRGWKTVHYHYDFITKDLGIELFNNEQNEVARFEGDSKYYRKVYDYEGRCR